MKNKEIVDSILESMREEVSAFISSESEITSSLEYEDRILELSRQFGKRLMEGGIGELPKSRNSKKSADESGEIRG